jgi:N-acetyl-anhydromuramyl-L-alanine amidase AmpD
MLRFTSKEAAEAFRALTAASHACLDVLKVPRIPKGRTRSWKVAGGPIGILYHYTGGTSGLKTLRWFNDPRWGNTGSSCHCLILDRVIPALEDVWPAQEAAALFPVPTLLIADLASGTWHGNWSNSRLFGIENRNTGYSGYQKLAGGLAELGKSGVQLRGRTWEPYTREQIVCNVQLGRLWAALRGGVFRPDWICGHSQIWATKADPGPAFPSMDAMRAAIWSAVPILELEMLTRFPLAMADEEAADDEDCSGLDGDRGDPQESLPGGLSGSLPAEVEAEVASWLWKLGWPTGPERPSPIILKDIVSRFQRSTGAWAKTNPPRPERVLVVDGIAGAKTRVELKAHLGRMKLL